MVLAFNSDDPSSNTTKSWLTILIETNGNVPKEAGFCSY